MKGHSLCYILGTINKCADSNNMTVLEELGDHVAHEPTLACPGCRQPNGGKDVVRLSRVDVGRVLEKGAVVLESAKGDR